jgi:putative Holliday junction resolvase
MGRVLALDYGEKRIGCALSDKSRIIASSTDYILNDNNLFANIKKLMTEKEADEIILGLPLTLSGEDSTQTVTVREFKEALEEELLCKVTLYDERLTTSYAQKILISGNINRKKRKQKVDSLSAQIFLQNYLDKLQKS